MHFATCCLRRIHFVAHPNSTQNVSVQSAEASLDLGSGVELLAVKGSCKANLKA